MNSRRLYSYFFFFLFVYSAKGQEINDTLTKQSYSFNNSIHFELLGNGILYSLNYEKKLIQFSNNKIITGRIGFRIGEHLTWVFNRNKRYLTDPIFIPVLFNLRKEKRKYMILGAGILFRATRYPSLTPGGPFSPPFAVIPTLRIGYYWSVKGRFFIEPALTPLSFYFMYKKYYNESKFIYPIPWVGFSSGFKF
jgi:hypothetical protein